MTIQHLPQMPFKEHNLRVSPYLGQSLYFDENEVHQKAYSQNSTHLNNTSISSLSDIESWEHSSVSSSSWFDDFDIKATVNIAKKLENIDEVLYNEADPGILEKQLQEECKEWMRAFPHFRVRGTVLHSKTSKVNNGKISKNSNISSPADTNLDYFNLEGLSLQINSNEVQFEKKHHRESSTEDVNRKIHPIENLELNSPIQQINHFYSAPSLMRSEISSSKWHRPDSSEYSSLPFIQDMSTSCNANVKMPERFFYGRKEKGTLKEKYRSSDQNQYLKLSKSKQNAFSASQNYFQTLPTRNKSLLPPIENPGNVRSSIFRSISATPRKYIPLVPIAKESNLTSMSGIPYNEKLLENNCGVLFHQNGKKMKNKIVHK